MTELEPYTPPITSVAHWAHEAADAHKLAQALVKTSFAPKPYRDKPDEAAAAILKGAEIGLTPVAALSAIHVIAGTPALSAMALRAIAQSQGHTVWIEKSTDKECIAHARRRGETEVHTSKWTIARANALGAPAKNPNWKTQPEAMLIARATSEVCRLVAADALLGIAYSVEELTDQDGEAEVTPIRRARRAGAVKAVTAGDAPAVPEPDVDEPPLDDEPTPEAAGTPEPMTDAMSRKLHALYGQIGWTDRADKIRAASLIVGRPLESSKDLTKDEGRQLIDELEQVAGADDPSDALTDLLEVLARTVDAEVVEGA